MRTWRGWLRRRALDLERFRGCLQPRETVPKILADTRAGPSLDLSSTPTLFFNGRRVKGTLADVQKYDLAVMIESRIAAGDTLPAVPEIPAAQRVTPTARSGLLSIPSRESAYDLWRKVDTCSTPHCGATMGGCNDCAGACCRVATLWGGRGSPVVVPRRGTFYYFSITYVSDKGPERVMPSWYGNC